MKQFPSRWKITALYLKRTLLCMAVFMKSTPDFCLILPKTGMYPTNFCTAPQHRDMKIHLAISVSLKLDRHTKLTSAFVVFGCKRTKNQTSEWKVVLQYRKSGEQIGISQVLLWNMHASFHESTKLLSYPGAALNLKQGSVYCTYCHLIHLANILLS